MVIKSKTDLRFFIAADRIMNGLPMRKTIKEVLVNMVDCPMGSIIVKYLYMMRKYAFYRNSKKKIVSVNSLLMVYYHRRWNKLGLRLGYSIGPNSLGYGAVLPHPGTIVVNQEARIGNFAVLHTSTCVAGGDKVVGDFFYLSAGSQLVGKLTLGEGVSVAAHSLVNHSYGDCCLIAGAPAHIKKDKYQLWPDRDGTQYRKRVEDVIMLYKRIYG